MKGYILSVVAAAIVCAVVRALLTEQSATGKVVRLLSGVLMAVTVISPLAHISFDRVGDYFDSISYQSDTYVAEGEAAAQESLAGVIKDQTESYILDKATRMGLDISVEVELDASNHSVPSGAIITGEISPYARELMSGFIEDTLGIAKENQKWI